MFSALRRSLVREGLSWRWQTAVFLTAALAVVSRRPDIVLNPQFWAEEGMFLFSQAYNLGWLHALSIPLSGYLQTFLRLVAGVSLLVPLRFAPLLMNMTGLALQVLPVTFLLSSRSVAFGTLARRLLYAGLYLALPNSWEVNGNLTCSQFHLALVTLLILLSRPPATAWWKAFDLLVIVATGSTGPFCVLLLPVALLFWLLRRDRWMLGMAALLAICAAVQSFTLLAYHGIGERVYQGPLGATPQRLVRILGGQVFAAAVVGQNDLGLSRTLGFNALVATGGLALVCYVLWKACLEFKLFVAFCFLLLAVSLAKPYIGVGEPAWVLLLWAKGCRYWLLPMLATAWSLAWCAFEAPQRYLRPAALAALAGMTFGIIRDWSYPPYPDRGFQQYSARFAAARPGTIMLIPINPDGWVLLLTKK